MEKYQNTPSYFVAMKVKINSICVIHKYKMGYTSIQLFDSKKIRTKWDAEQDKWYFSVIDIVEGLTESMDAKQHWSVLKSRLKKEGCEPTSNCSTLKMPAADSKPIAFKTVIPVDFTK